jgi:DNA-binding CsgD family transcriptional regulator
VRHLLVLVDFLCLAAGIAFLARLLALHRAERSARSGALLGFFCAYSYVMVTSTLFAYATVNIGVASSGHVALASLIFVGMAALEITLPRMVFADRGIPQPLLARRLLLAGAALTAAQAGLVWTPLGQGPAPFACAFAPFGAAVAWGAASGRPQPLAGEGGTAAGGAAAGSASRADAKDRASRAGPPAWPFAAAYALILLGSAFEIRAAIGRPAPRDYLPISLPLAYLTSSLQLSLALAHRRSAGAPGARAPAALELPVALVGERRLSPREAEIAACILEGLGNKEIAARLGISENTARNHIYSLYQKLGIRKRMDLLGLVRGSGQGA